jgi:hypothetical protein
MLANCCVFPSGVLIRRQVFDRVGLFDETLHYCEDYDLLLRIFESHAVVHVPVEGYLYRRHGEQASQAVERMCRSAVAVVRRAQARYPYPRALIRDRFAVFAYRQSQSAWRQRRYFRGIYHLGRAAFQDPGRAVGELLRRFVGSPGQYLAKHLQPQPAGSRTGISSQEEASWTACP